MNDVFLECLVKRKSTVKSIAVKALWFLAATIVSLVLGIVIIGYFINLIIMWPLGSAGAVIAAVILSRRQNVEFEYIISGWDMAVDKVVSKRSRKRLFKIDVRKFEILAPVSEAFEKEMENTEKYIDASSTPYADGLWFTVFEGKGKIRTLFIFEPNARVLSCLRKQIPKKIKEIVKE